MSEYYNRSDFTSDFDYQKFRVKIIGKQFVLLPNRIKIPKENEREMSGLYFECITNKAINISMIKN
jgi:hypothetical protein